MELAEVLQGLFSRKPPGNTSCDAFLHFNSLIRAQPKGNWCTSSSTTLSSPPGTLGFGGREGGGDHTACVGAAPDSGVYKRIFAFCYCIFLLQMTPTSLSSNITWLGVECASRLCSSEAASVFSAPRVFLLYHHFLVRILSRIAKSAFSFSQCSAMFPASTLGPSLPLEHILKPLMGGVNEDVRDPHKLHQAPACFSRT